MNSKWLDFVDNRLKKCIKAESSILHRYSAIVVNIVAENFFCKISGSDLAMPFLNKSGEELEIGNCVFIESSGNSLTNGVITIKFK